MRTIKFRGKRIEREEWVIGNCIQIAGSQEYFISNSYSCTSSLAFVVKPETVGQFTGLYDKNDNEIYEGDILVWGENDCKSQPMVVIFKHGSFGYTFIEDWFHSFAGNTNFTFNPLNTDVRFEIVGNIHDNPELLKGGAK